MRIPRHIASIAAVLALAACSTSPVQQTAAVPEKPVTIEEALQLKDDGKVADAAGVMLKYSEQISENERPQYLFETAQLYLQIPDSASAADVLKRLKTLAPENNYTKILNAQVSLRYGDPSGALAYLSSVSLGDVTPVAKGAYWLTSAEAYEISADSADCISTDAKGKAAAGKKAVPFNTCISSALQAYTSAEEFLASARTLTKNQDAIWRLMSLQTVPSLKLLKSKTKETSVKAWLDLAILAKESKGAVREKDMNAWRSRYPNQVILNQRLLDLRDVNAAKLKHLALILPTKSSELGASAKAVWEGFKSAQKEGLVSYPVKLYETDANPASTLNAYNSAIAKGAVMIVGPLPRKSLALLAQRKLLAVPTIALNVIEDEKVPVNLYQFGLPIAHEARVIARAAKEKGFSQAIILKGNSPLDARSSEAFAKEWISLQNTVKGEAPIQDAAQIAQMTAANEGENIMVFVASDFQTASPVFKSLPPNWTIFGTSSLNTNSPAVHNLDKNQKIYFVDIPALVNNVLLTEKVSAPVKSSYVNSRLYSLGLDVYRLSALLLHDEIKFNRILIDGATGKLRIARNGNVERDLPLILLQEANVVKLDQPLNK